MAAQCFWTEHPLPDPALADQAEWAALTDAAKQKVMFLQELSAALLMHHSKLYLGSKITQVLIRSLALARRQAQEYPWETFVAVIHDRLEDPSARQMIESTSSLRRTDGMDLATWVRTLIMCRTLLLKSGVQ